MLSLFSSTLTFPQLRFQEADIVLSLSVSASIIFPILQSQFSPQFAVCNPWLSYISATDLVLYLLDVTEASESELIESHVRGEHSLEELKYASVSFAAGPEPTSAKFRVATVHLLISDD